MEYDEFGGVIVSPAVPAPVQPSPALPAPKATPVTFYSLGADVGGPDETQDKWTNRGYSSKGPNLTPGVVAVNDKVIPLGTVLKDADSGLVFLATDRHGNRDPNVVDVYTAPDQYKREKVTRNFQIIGKLDKIPTTAEGVREALGKYGTVPEGPSARESLAGANAERSTPTATGQALNAERSSGEAPQAGMADNSGKADYIDVPGLPTGEPERDEFGGIIQAQAPEAGRDEFGGILLEETPQVKEAATVEGGDKAQAWWKNWTNSLGRGASSEGPMMAAQGLYNAAGAVVGKNEFTEVPTPKLRTDLEATEKQLEETLDIQERTREGYSGPSLGEQQTRAHLNDMRAELMARDGKESADYAFKNWLDSTGQEAGRVRKTVRETLAVDDEFAASLTGQILQGLGQLSTVPAYAVPGVGEAVTFGQLYQEARDDYAQTMERDGKPVDEAQAHRVALEYLAGAAPLEVLTDRLILGKALQTAKGKLTVGSLAKTFALLGATGGTSEGSQQAWLNTVAKELEGYDPERKLDDGVIESVIVGGVVSGLGGSAAEVIAPRAKDGETRGRGETEKVDRVDLSKLEGANSQEQFENLARKAGVPMDAPRDEFGGIIETEAPAPVEPATDEFGGVIVEPAPEIEDGVIDPFAIDEDPAEVAAEAAARQAEAEYRAEMEAEIAETLRAEREASGSVEIAEAVEQLGGLPGRGSEYEKAYAGELQNVRESVKANRRMRLFRKDAPDPDRLVTSLRDMGFDIEGPNQLWDILDSRFRNETEHWSEPNRTDDYWQQRQGMMMEPTGTPRAAFAPSSTAKQTWHAGVDAVVKDAGTRAPVMFPETPIVLQKLGLPDYSMTMRSEAAAKVLGLTSDKRHALTAAQLKQLPRELSNPLAVFASDNPEFPNSMVVVTAMTETDHPVIVAIHPNKKAGRTTVHVIASAYGKERWQKVFAEWVKRDRLKYFNTEKKGPWSQSAELQSLLEATKGSSKVLTQADIVKTDRVEEDGWQERVRRPAPFTPEETAARGDAAAEALGSAPVSSVSQALAGTPTDEFAAQEKLVALAWRREMLHKGKVDFVGREIRNARELAMAAQVYRDPRFETVRWLFVKQGKVVDTVGITSRNPRFVMALLPGQSLSDMMRIADKSGADTLYLLHNHPSGDPMPSGPDKALTQTIADAARSLGSLNFGGHVVINGKHFAVIKPDGSHAFQALPEPDNLLVPEIDHELLGKVMKTRTEITEAASTWARLAADQKTGKGQVTLFLTDTKRKIRALTTVPLELFLDRQRLPAYLHARGSLYGVTFATAYYDAPHGREMVADAMGEYVRGAVLEDGLLSPGEIVKAEHGAAFDAPGDRYFGEDIQKLRNAVAAMEDTDGRLADLAVKDGPLRVLSADGKNLYATVPLKGLPDIKIIEMPEMLRFAREIMGSDPILRRMRSSLGQFVGAGDGAIRLDPRIFSDSTVAAKVFAHEIGHLVDYLPDHDLKRGNLIGRLYTLKKHLKGTAFGSITGIKNSEIKAELEGLTKWWKPWDEAAAPQWYNDYRKSSVELYADAVSVLFNSPGELKARAPKFYREFFAWLDKKAEVKRAFFELQAFLHKPYMEVLRARSGRVREMFGKAEEVFLRHRERRRAQKLNTRGFIDTLKDELYDRFNPVIRRQEAVEKEGGTIQPDLDMRKLFDEHPMADNLVYTWLNRVFERVVKPLEAVDITLDDMGEYLFFSRVMADRSGMANPQGHTADTARAALLRMRLDVGNAKFTLLERAAAQWHDYVFDTVKDAAAAGLISQETFNTVIVPNRGTYAAFRPIDHVEDYVPAGILQQVGTLKEIENPWLTTVLKTIAMRRAIQYHRAKVGAVEFLTEYFPDEITAAATRFDGKRNVPLPVKDKERGLIEIRRDGKWAAYEVPADVARMFEREDPATVNGVIKTLNFAFKGIFYNLWVRYNPVFQLAYSPIRDAQRYYVNMPKAGVMKLAANYLKSLPVALDRLKGRDNPLLTEMYETFAIATPHDSFARNLTRQADAFDEVLKEFHILPREEQSRWRNNAIVKPIGKVLRGIEFVGQIFEAAPKVSAYRVLTRDLGYTPSDAAVYVRNYIGVPNYLRKGRHAFAAGSILPFWNVATQGLASDGALMSGRGEKHGKTAASWWFRWALAGGMYAVVQALARSGLLGEEAEEMFGGVSDYDATNFMIIPLGTVSGGEYGRKVVYIRVPQDEMHRMTSGLLKKVIELTVKHANDEAVRPAFNDVLQLAGYSGGQLPGINPALGIASKWVDYSNGNNPYDSFRGRHVLSNNEWLAGGWSSFKPMLGMTFNDAGLGNFYRYNPEADTTLEMTLGNAPILQRLVKVSDRGFAEQQRATITRGQAEDARLKMELGRISAELAQEHNFLRSLSKQRTPAQEARYGQLREWNRRIYTPTMEAAEAQRDAGVDYKATLGGLEAASAGWK